MSNDYRTFPTVTVSMLFDGRLERFNVREGRPDDHLDFDGNPLRPVDREAQRRAAMGNDWNYVWDKLDQKLPPRSLTDGSNVVLVCSDEAGNVDNLILVGPNESDILDAIEVACDCRIVSEDDPQFWGYDTWEECFAKCADVGNEHKHEHRDEFFAEVAKFLHGDPSRFRPGTLGMEMAERARMQIRQRPELIERENQAILLELIF